MEESLEREKVLNMFGNNDENCTDIVPLDREVNVAVTRVNYRAIRSMIILTIFAITFSLLIHENPAFMIALTLGIYVLFEFIFRGQFYIVKNVKMKFKNLFEMEAYLLGEKYEG